MEWPDVVKTAARGIAQAVKSAQGNCVSVSPSGLFEYIGKPFHPMIASQFRYVLDTLESMGFVSHRRIKRYGRKGKVFYVICREANPMTDGHFNPVLAGGLWVALKELPLEDAVRLLAGLILSHDGAVPLAKTPKPNHNSTQAQLWLMNY